MNIRRGLSFTLPQISTRGISLVTLIDLKRSVARSRLTKCSDISGLYCPDSSSHLYIRTQYRLHGFHPTLPTWTFAFVGVYGIFAHFATVASRARPHHAVCPFSFTISNHLERPIPSAVAACFAVSSPLTTLTCSSLNRDSSYCFTLRPSL